jgi:3-oxoacid CoA-transferase subunit A
VGTVFEEGYASVELEGRRYLLAPAIRGDVAIVRAHLGDRFGNLFFRHASRNFNPLVAMAARLTIAEVAEIVEPGDIDPHHVHVPSVFVDRLVATT